MEFTPLQLSFLVFCSLLIGVAKSGFAGGIGILVTPLLALVIDPRMALGMLLPLLFSSDLFNFYHYWKQWETRALSLVVPGSIVGVLIGWPLLRYLKDAGSGNDYLGKAIGLTALVFGTFTLLRDLQGKLEVAYRPTGPQGFIAGAVAGAISTIAHQGGLITQVYLIPQRLTPQAFVASTTVIYFTINLTKIPVYFIEGVLDMSRLVWSLFFIPLVFAGSFIGKYLNRKLNPRIFTRIIIVFVLFTAVKLLFG